MKPNDVLYALGPHITVYASYEKELKQELTNEKIHS